MLQMNPPSGKLVNIKCSGIFNSIKIIWHYVMLSLLELYKEQEKVSYRTNSVKIKTPLSMLIFRVARSHAPL